MSRAPSGVETCKVWGVDKLPAGVDRQLICQAVAQAMTKAAPNARYHVVINILSTSRMAADLVVDGRILPRQHMAVSDGKIGPNQIKRFAASLAALAARQ